MRCPRKRLDLDTLKDVNVYTRQGTVVPLSQIATRAPRARGAGAVAPQSRHGDHRARRRQGRRAGRVGRRRRSLPALKDIEAKLPSGYRIDVGGAVEESDKANKALPPWRR